MSPPTSLLSRRDMALWARYLRTVHVQYCPFTHGATPAAWLAMITTKKVKQASPKLAITKELLPQRKAGAAPTASLAFADGSTTELDLSSMQVRDILETIDMANGQIAQAEAARGRPFS